MNLVRVLRLLVAAEIVLVVTSGVSGMILVDFLPEMLQQYSALQDDSGWGPLQIAFYLIVFALLIAGWVGLWKLKPWARLVYTTAWILSLLIAPMLGPSVMHGIEYMLSDLATLAAGMILALVWFSPLAVHFSRRLPNPSGEPNRPADT